MNLGDDETRTRICELLDLCPCLDDKAIELFIAELKICADQDTQYQSAIESQIIRSYLDNIELIEHGVTIRGSWLTKKGDLVLEELSK